MTYQNQASAIAIAYKPEWSSAIAIDYKPEWSVLLVGMMGALDMNMQGTSQPLEQNHGLLNFFALKEYPKTQCDPAWLWTYQHNNKNVSVLPAVSLE